MESDVVGSESTHGVLKNFYSFLTGSSRFKSIVHVEVVANELRDVG